MRMSQAASTASMLLLAAACAGSPSPATSPAPVTADQAEGGRQERAIDVEVDNQNFYDMDVYLVTGGTRWLVGRVGGLTKETLTIPATLAPADQRVRLLAEAIGSQRAIFTPTLVVPPGEQVYWTIGSDPSMSTASAG